MRVALVARARPAHDCMDGSGETRPGTELPSAHRLPSTHWPSYFSPLGYTSLPSPCIWPSCKTWEAHHSAEAPDEGALGQEEEQLVICPRTNGHDEDPAKRREQAIPSLGAHLDLAGILHAPQSLASWQPTARYQGLRLIDSEWTRDRCNRANTHV
jgi:hypothetical protein